MRHTCWCWPPSWAFRLALCWPCENLPLRADRPSGPTSRCRTQSLPVTSFTTNHNRALMRDQSLPHDQILQGDRPGAHAARTVSVAWKHQLRCYLSAEKRWELKRLLLWRSMTKWRHCSNLFQSLWWRIIPPASHSSFPCLCSRLLWTGPSLHPETSGRESSGDACSCSHRQNNFHIHFPPVGEDSSLKYRKHK